MAKKRAKGKSEQAMVVLLLERVPASLRGELSRWLIEPKTGVFVGNISAMVRDKLWDSVVKGAARNGKGAALLIHSAQNEQGFSVRASGDTSRVPRDWEGLTLVHIPQGARGATDEL